MLLRHWGRIVNIVSASGEVGAIGQSNYSASKAGVIGLTRTLAREFARQGVLVNAVSPGLIETDMIAGLTAERRQEMLQIVALGRTGRPEEVSALVAFLVSPGRQLYYGAGHRRRRRTSVGSLSRRAQGSSSAMARGLSC